MGRGLHGRDSELAAMTIALDEARAGTTRAFAIVGEPGIGKTRLTTEVAERAALAGFQVCWGRAWEAGGAPPYWPWRLLFESIPGAKADPALAQVWGRRQGASAIDPAQARFELFDAAANAIRTASAATPLLCILDDVHAADIPSIELAVFAARDRRATRVVWLMTWRDAEALREPVRDLIARIGREARMMPLLRLSSAEADCLIDEVRAETPVEMRRALIEATGGNPLFLVETLACIDAGKTLDLARLPLAQGVGAVVRERAAPLAVEVRRMLDAAAVVGRDVGIERWAAAAATTPEVIRRHADAIVGTGMLDELGVDRWRFCHELVRDAIERAMSHEDLAEAHRRIALALDEQARLGDASIYGERAHHALVSTGMAPRTVLDWVIAAAEHARLQGAYEAASGLLERAMTTLGSIAREDAGLLLAVGRTRADSGDHEAASAAFHAAIEVAQRTNDAEHLARGVLGLGSHFTHGNIRTDLVTMIDDVATRLPPDAHALHARLLARKAAALTPPAEVEVVLAMARDAMELVAGSRDLEAQLEVANSVSSTYSEFAHPRERLIVDGTMVRLARRLGDRALELRGLSGLVTDHMRLGELAKADAVLVERDALARSLKLARFAWQAPLFRSMRAMTVGDFAACDAAIAEAEAMGASVADGNIARTLGRHRMWLMLVADRTNDLRAHEPVIVDALRGVPAIVAQAARAVIRFRCATAAETRGEIDKLAPELPHLPLNMLASLGEAVAAVGPSDLMRVIYDRLAPHADTFAVQGQVGLTCGPPVAAILGLLAAALDERDRAEAHFDSAHEAASTAGAQAFVTWTQRWRERALGPVVTTRPASALPLELRMQAHGDVWTIAHAGRSFPVSNVRGMAMIAQLIARPNVELHVLELVSGGADSEELGDSGELLDKHARDAYRRRATELAEVIEEAEDRGQVDRAERAREELEALQRELSRAIGRGGRVRRAGVAAERARTTVQRRIREAIKKIADSDGELGARLDRGIRTGTYCVFRNTM